jgi:hypothetical protein
MFLCPNNNRPDDLSAMAESGYGTHAACVLKFQTAGRWESFRGRLASISTAGAEVVCEKSFPSGSPVRLVVEGAFKDELAAQVTANEGSSGDGFRMTLRLTAGSWPYQVFAMLTTLAMGGGGGASPPCLVELGLKLPCSVEQVEQAFSRKVRTAHPDRGGDVESFVRLRAAYLEALALLGGSR